MKHALIVGGGSGNGAAIVDTLIDKGYSVVNIGQSSHPYAINIEINWKDLDIIQVHKLCKFENQFDFVFFNHNASSLNSKNFDPANQDTLKTWKLIKDWQHSHWLSCQMPYLIIHSIKKNLTEKSKIGWMLSTNMEWDRNGVEEFPDYSTNKFFNYMAMKCFSSAYQTFGIAPSFKKPNSRELLLDILNRILESDAIDQRLYKF